MSDMSLPYHTDAIMARISADEEKPPPMLPAPEGTEPGSTYHDEHDRLIRTAGGYKYYDKSFREVHTTSVPINDEEALDYFGVVSVWFDELDQPRYLARRALDGSKFDMLPYEYNYMTGETQGIA